MVFKLEVETLPPDVAVAKLLANVLMAVRLTMTSVKAANSCWVCVPAVVCGPISALKVEVNVPAGDVAATGML